MEWNVGDEVQFGRTNRWGGWIGIIVRKTTRETVNVKLRPYAEQPGYANHDDLPGNGIINVPTSVLGKPHDCMDFPVHHYDEGDYYTCSVCGRLTQVG